MKLENVARCAERGIDVTAMTSIEALERLVEFVSAERKLLLDGIQDALNFEIFREETGKSPYGAASPFMLLQLTLRELDRNRAMLAASPPATPTQDAQDAKRQYGEMDDYRACEFCGCRTNAKARRCCNKGRDADAAMKEGKK